MEKDNEVKKLQNKIKLLEQRISRLENKSNKIKVQNVYVRTQTYIKNGVLEFISVLIVISLLLRNNTILILPIKL